MSVDVDPGDRERVVGQVGRVDLDLGPGQRRQHREAAVAGAQVQHAAGALGQPRVDRAVGQWLGDQRARDDHALVDMEGHALQPGLAGQVGGRLAGRDAAVDQRRGRGGLGGRDRTVGLAVERVQRQAERPLHQPGRLVEGIGRAVAKRNARLSEAGALRMDEVDQRHAGPAGLPRRD